MTRERRKKDRLKSGIQFSIDRTKAFGVFRIASLIALLSLLVYFVSPSNIIIIFVAHLIVGTLIFEITSMISNMRVGVLCGLVSAGSSFLYVIDLLNTLNGVIFVCLLLSLGLFLFQK